MKYLLPILTGSLGGQRSEAAPELNMQKAPKAGHSSRDRAERQQVVSIGPLSRDVLRSEGGLYAEVGRSLVDLSSNLTVLGRTRWTMTNSDNCTPSFRPESSKEQSQIANPVSSLEVVGASACASRATTHEAVRRFNVNVPDAYARRHHDLTGTDASLPVHVSETETVVDAQNALSLANDSARREGMAANFGQCFILNVHDIDRSVLKDVLAEDYDSVEVSAFVKQFYLDLYEESETFAALYNWALDNGRLGSDRRWSIHIQDPNMICERGTSFDQVFHVNPATRSVYVPSLRSPIQLDESYISFGGNLVSYTPEHVLIHEMVHVLTGMYDPDLSAWKDQHWHADTQRISEFGLGERGAVEFLAQTILKEAGIDIPQRLSYLSLSEDDRVLLHLAGVADYNALEQYVKRQDDYLDALIGQLRERSRDVASSGDSEVIRRHFQDGPASAGSLASRKRLNFEDLEPDLAAKSSRLSSSDMANP